MRGTERYLHSPLVRWDRVLSIGLQIVILFFQICLLLSGLWEISLQEPVHSSYPEVFLIRGLSTWNWMCSHPMKNPQLGVVHDLLCGRIAFEHPVSSPQVVFTPSLVIGHAFALPVLIQRRDHGMRTSSYSMSGMDQPHQKIPTQSR